MRKPIRFFTWCALMMTLAVVIFGYQVYTRSMNGELGNKEDFAILQGVELEHRNDIDRASLMLIKNLNQTGRDVAGFPAGTGLSTRVWVTLNKTGGDGTVFAVPDRLKDKILCADIDIISSKKQASSKVLDYLHLFCLK